MPTIFEEAGEMRNAYEVEYGNLKQGSHEFDFQLDKVFFDRSEESILKNGNINVLLHLERTETHLTLKFSLKGVVECQCDICLSDLEYPIDAEEILQAKITDSFGEEEPDLIYLSTREHKVDIYQHLYDYVHLALPMKVVCEDSVNRSECDESVLERLNNDSNKEPEVNPEWEKLKDLFK